MELTLDQALQKGIEAHKAGQVKDAEKLYTAILKAQPEHPDANHNMGLLAVGAGKLQEALPFFKTALEANPGIGQFWLSYIDALIKLGRSVDAQAIFVQAKDKGATGVAFDQLEKRLSGSSINIQDPPSEQLQSIIKLYTQGQLQQALSVSSQMLEIYPNSVVLYNIAGVSNAGLMQYDAAIESYRQALKIKPDFAEAYNNMGNALNKKGDPEAAIESYSQALKIKPDYADAYNNMGIALNDKGELEAAIASFREALQINPDFADAYNNIGNVLKDKGELAAAIISFKQALKINPNFADGYNNIGNVLKDKGDLEAAITSYKQALKIRPDFAEAYNNMGNALQDKGELEAAITRYKQALKIRPDYAEAYNNMGMTLQELGSKEASEASYRQALAMKSDFAGAHYNLGLLLLEDRCYEKAAVHLKLSDSDTSKYFLLKCLYLQDKKSLFYDQLDYLINQGKIHPMIGSFSCRSELRYGKERPNLFCKDPLNYAVKTDLSDQYDFETIFVKSAKTILNERRVSNRKQNLLTNGYQTSGNLFSLEDDLTQDIQKIIRLEVDKYLVNFKDSKEGLITSWPADYSLYGWLVSMKSGGELQPHMHEKGWISGSIYINVPSKLKADSGNLVVCIEEEQLRGENENEEKSIDVVTGSLCLFPASLLHYTIPFDSEEDRIVLAFDVVPNN